MYNTSYELNPEILKELSKLTQDYCVEVGKKRYIDSLTLSYILRTPPHALIDSDHFNGLLAVMGWVPVVAYAPYKNIYGLPVRQGDFPHVKFLIYDNGLPFYLFQYKPTMKIKDVLICYNEVRGYPNTCMLTEQQHPQLRAIAKELVKDKKGYLRRLDRIVTTKLTRDFLLSNSPTVRVKRILNERLKYPIRFMPVKPPEPKNTLPKLTKEHFTMAAEAYASLFIKYTEEYSFTLESQNSQPIQYEYVIGNDIYQLVTDGQYHITPVISRLFIELLRRLGWVRLSWCDHPVFKVKAQTSFRLKTRHDPKARKPISIFARVIKYDYSLAEEDYEGLPDYYYIEKGTTDYKLLCALIRSALNSREKLSDVNHILYKDKRKDEARPVQTFSLPDLDFPEPKDYFTQALPAYDDDTAPY